MTLEWPSPTGSTSRVAGAPAGARPGRPSSGSRTSNGYALVRPRPSAWVRTRSSGATWSAPPRETLVLPVACAPPAPRYAQDHNLWRSPAVPGAVARSSCDLPHNSHRHGVRPGRAARPATAQASHSPVADLRGGTRCFKNPATRTQALRRTRRRFGVHSMRVRSSTGTTSRRQPDSRHQAELRCDRSRTATTGATYDPDDRRGSRRVGGSLLLTALRVRSAVGHQRQARDNGDAAQTRPSSQSSWHAARPLTTAQGQTRGAIWNEPNQPQFLLPQYSPAQDAALAGDLPQALLRRPAPA